MSFIDELKVIDNNLLSARLNYFTTSIIEKYHDHPFRMDVNKEYIAQVHYDYKFKCMEADLSPALDTVKRKLRQDLYGDFIDDLLNLKMVLYEGDYKKSIDKLDKILSNVTGCRT